MYVRSAATAGPHLVPAACRFSLQNGSPLDACRASCWHVARGTAAAREVARVTPARASQARRRIAQGVAYTVGAVVIPVLAILALWATPVAEESELIIDVGRFVIERTAFDATRFRAIGASAATIRLGVNLSARNLLSPELIADVRAAISAAGGDGTALRQEFRVVCTRRISEQRCCFTGHRHLSRDALI